MSGDTNSNDLQALRLAARLGDAEAQFRLGEMYEKGEGVEQDYEHAAELYLEAARQGNADAQNNLAFMYFKGEYVK